MNNTKNTTKLSRLLTEEELDRYLKIRAEKGTTEANRYIRNLKLTIED